MRTGSSSRGLGRGPPAPRTGPACTAAGVRRSLRSGAGPHAWFTIAAVEHAAGASLVDRRADVGGALDVLGRAQVVAHGVSSTSATVESRCRSTKWRERSSAGVYQNGTRRGHLAGSGAHDRQPRRCRRRRARSTRAPRRIAGRRRCRARAGRPGSSRRRPASRSASIVAGGSAGPRDVHRQTREGRPRCRSPPTRCGRRCRERGRRSRGGAARPDIDDRGDLDARRRQRGRRLVPGVVRA